MLHNIVQNFTEHTIDRVKSFKNPSKELKNTLLVFLTLFHETLDEYLPQHSASSSSNRQEYKDKEWKIIISFFDHPREMVSLIRKTEALIQSRAFGEVNLEKAAQIYNSLDIEEWPKEEELVGELFEDFIEEIF